MPDWVEGYVNKVIYTRDDFSVFTMNLLKSEPEESAYAHRNATVRGSLHGLQQIQFGVPLHLIGRWTKHPKYGTQFLAHLWEPWFPDERGLENFLYSCIEGFASFRLINKVISKYGLSAFQNRPDSLDPFLDDPPEGVPVEELQDAVLGWEKAFRIRDLSSILRFGGLNGTEIQAVLYRFGSDAGPLIKQNPYCLMALLGFDFSKVDRLARRLNIPEGDPRRYEGAVLWALQDAAKQGGHLCLPRTSIPDAVTDLSRRETLVPFPAEGYKEAFGEAVRNLEKNGVVRSDPDVGIYLPEYYDFERKSADLLSNLLKPSDISLDTESFLEEYERINMIQLSDAQRKVVEELGNHRVVVLTGLPGTGKTTVVRALVRFFENAGVSFMLLAPTGIAAKRLASVAGHAAHTVHRALRYDGSSWGYNENNPLSVEAIVVDESCLPYRQFIDLADGSRRYIGTVVNQKQKVEVLSFNQGTGEIEPKPVTGWFKYPRQHELYEIKLSLAKSRERRRVLRCTGRHKVYTPEGQRRASELRVGDSVLVKGAFLNPFQRSFLLGSLLGDSCLTGRPSGRRVQFVHSQDQLSYLRFKSRVFQCGEPYPTRGGYSPEKTLWHCYSPIIDDLDDLYPIMYEVAGKRIFQSWLNEIDEVGLAAWYMDDGSLSRQGESSPCALLHTEGFCESDCRKLSEWLSSKWSLQASVYHNGRGHFYLRLTCESSRLFWDMISPWVIPAMGYKLPDEFETSFQAPGDPYLQISSYPVRSIRKYTPRDNTGNFVYDIQVEGNHNYLSNGVLVSNSMVDQELFYRLLSSLGPDSTLVFVGDDAQLPSVGPGNVLRELVSCSDVPNVRLTQIFRQGERSSIVQRSHEINRGEMLNLKSYKDDPEFKFVRMSDEEDIASLIVRMAEKLKSRDANFQVLSAKYDGTVGVTNLNSMLREALNPEGPPEWNKGAFRLGDRLMVIKNDYELGVYNGDVGKLIRIDEKQGLTVRIHGVGGQLDVEVTFPPDVATEKLRLAYAITVHKSQGSEFDTIIFPIMRSQGRMLQRNLLYTAVTRARKRVWLIGEEAAIQRAIMNNKVVRRGTALAESISKSFRAGVERVV